ncbi:hypothetical protein SAU060112_10177 [Staphylococcus aureus]|nr:hypothetical protein SAU060112_10177 [Staphylococcus aureus]
MNFKCLKLRNQYRNHDFSRKYIRKSIIGILLFIDVKFYTAIKIADAHHF